VSQYDPQATYDFHDAQGIKSGQVRQGKLYMSDNLEGHIEDGVFFDGAGPAGKLDGLTLVRDEDGARFELVLQEAEQA